jgi:tryptophan synthase alpha chain
MRQFTKLPIAVGFGISIAEQVRDVQRYADAVVVGSAIVADIERIGVVTELAGAIEKFLTGLQDFS